MSELLPELGPLRDNEQDITVRIWWDDSRPQIVGVNGHASHNAAVVAPWSGGIDFIGRPERFGLTPPERTFDVVVKLTESQVRYRARYARPSITPTAADLFNQACVEIVVEIDGEVRS